MKILLSPAKSLNFESEIPTEFYTKSAFLKNSKIINQKLRTLTPKDLMQLMDISDNLATLNDERNKKWKTPFNLTNARQAVFAFDGDVYTGLDAYTIESEKYDFLQKNIRILSGLYGILKPFDLIQPYRLEMGVSLAVEQSKSLYEYWKTDLTNFLNKELKKGEILLNLASVEYFSVVDKKSIKAPIITVDFKEMKNGQLKVVSFFAKKARGLMARYIIDNEIEDIEQIKNFDKDNYRFDDNLSKPNHLIFWR